MIYDRSIIIYELTAGTQLRGTLTERSRHLCAPRTVAHRRYWMSVQSDTRIDADVQIPYGDGVSADMYALYDGHLHRIEEAQHTEDGDGLPITRLSLRRMEANYDLCKPEDAAQ